MNRTLFIFAVTACIAKSSLAQSHQPGTLSFQASVDLGVHGTVYHSEDGGIVLANDTSSAATTLFSLSAQYQLNNWLSVGVNGRTGVYHEDPENAEEAGNHIRTLSADLRLYPVNKENFNWYLGVDYGIAALEINRNYVFIVPFTAEYDLSGSHLGLFTGFNWYFLDFAGIHMNLAYSRHAFDLKHYYLSGQEQDLGSSINTLDALVVHFQAGLSFRIN